MNGSHSISLINQMLQQLASQITLRFLVATTLTDFSALNDHSYIMFWAQEKLGELVYVALPEVGKVVDRGAEAGTVESVKAATEVYSPIPGTVVSQNSALLKEPTLINKKPYNDGSYHIYFFYHYPNTTIFSY